MFGGIQGIQARQPSYTLYHTAFQSALYDLMVPHIDLVMLVNASLAKEIKADGERTRDNLKKAFMTAGLTCMDGRLSEDRIVTAAQKRAHWNLKTILTSAFDLLDAKAQKEYLETHPEFAEVLLTPLERLKWKGITTAIDAVDGAEAMAWGARKAVNRGLDSIDDFVDQRITPRARKLASDYIKPSAEYVASAAERFGDYVAQLPKTLPETFTDPTLAFRQQTEAMAALRSSARHAPNGWTEYLKDEAASEALEISGINSTAARR